MPTPEYLTESKRLSENTGFVMDDMFQSPEAEEAHEKFKAKREAAHKAEVEYLARKRARRQKQREIEAEEKQQRYEVARAVEDARLEVKKQRPPDADELQARSEELFEQMQEEVNTQS